MICSVMRDVMFLSLPSAKATKDDITVADNLLDTLKANSEKCVGMAANIIGVNKAIIAFLSDESYLEMFNPEIVKCDGKYETEEGCLSLEGTGKTTRYHSIKVRWQTREMKPKIKTFTGFTAEIIQHEIDHIKGIII